MPDDLNKKQENPFLRKEEEIRKEEFSDQKSEAPKSPEQGESFDSKKTDDKIEEILKEGELGQGNIVNVGNKRSENSSREKKIEKILESDMDSIYLEMRPEKRMEFKKLGEETSMKINQMIDSGKIKFKKVVNLIKKWLSIVPGINKFFLEQEAKLKTDEIMKMAKKSEDIEDIF